MPDAWQRYDGLSDPELTSLVADAVSQRTRLQAARESDVIRALIDNGMERRAAVAQMQNRMLAWFARKFYIDTIDAAFGDGEAKVRVEHCRAQWARLRRAEGAQAG